MVRGSAAAEAAQYARITPNLSVGLHLDLGEWIYNNGQWVALYVVTAANHPAAIRAEAVRQLETFRRLMGCDPTHLDSHQHVHHSPPTEGILLDMGDRIGV